MKIIEYPNLSFLHSFTFSPAEHGLREGEPTLASSLYCVNGII